MTGVSSPGVKQKAFGALLGFRRSLQIAGMDSLAQRHPALRSALRAVYRRAYGKLQTGDWVTGEIGGLRISANADKRDLALLLQSGSEWEPGQARLIESLLSEGQTFVDVGAHIGLYTLRAARRVGTAGHVFSFEPAPENFRALEFNIRQNGFSNVTAEPAAVARERGRAILTLSADDSASHSLAETLHGGQRIEVATISLDEYFRDYRSRIDVVKIDAEGAELGILDGMEQVLAANPKMALLTEIYPRAMEAMGSSPLEFLERLDSFGFMMASFATDGTEGQRLTPREFPPLLERLRERGVGTNLICRRSGAAERAAIRLSGHETGTASPARHTGARAPLISIAIPTYNRGELLERTLAGILPQANDGVEVVVLDTGSTDGTRQRIGHLQEQYPILRFIETSERRTLDDALLELLAVCRGDYVWFFSSDDNMKPGAIRAARERILASAVPPALVYVNQQIADESGKTLIASQVGRRRNRDFRDGRAILPFLGLNLGFISASLIRRESALRISSAHEFSGTRSLNLHLYLGCLLAGGPALYIGEPWIEARRASGRPPYEYSDVFVRGIVRILEDARRRGFSHWMIFQTMQRVVAGPYLRLVVSWRADDPEELERTFPVMRRACWMHPAFWLLAAPARYLPRKFVHGFRDFLRDRRNVRNANLQARQQLAEKTRAATHAAGA